MSINNPTKTYERNRKRNIERSSQTSYLKQIVVKNLTITSVEDETNIAVLGDTITSILAIEYYENIFEPVIQLDVVFVSNDNALSKLKLRGTERVSIEIEHPTGTLEFDDLVLVAFVQNQSESTATTFTIRAQPVGVVNNEKNRVTQRYDPKVVGTVHVKNILQTQIGASEDDIDIEDSANQVGFFGNYWRPFKALYWIAKRSISGSMPEEGGATDRVGFLFWQTKSGYKFKSIDTMISDSKKGTVYEYVQNDAISDNPNFDLYEPRFEVDQNIILQMMNSMYGESRRFFNLHTLKLSGDIPFNKSDAQQAHLGEEETTEVKYDINENPSVPTRNVVMDFTMRRDGTIHDGSEKKLTDGEYDPHRIISQSRMRYQSLLSRSLRVSVAMNLDLEAGDVVSIKLIDTMRGTDEWMSGLYIIKDLKHSYITRKNGVQCYTYLRLIKDTPGDD